MNLTFPDEAWSDEGVVSINEHQGQCEHCGDTEHGDASIGDGSTWWCVDCFECDHELTDSQLADIKAREVIAKRAYHEKALQELS